MAASSTEARPARPTPPPAAAPPELPGLRAWFIGYVIWLAALTLFAQRMFADYEAGSLLAMRLWLLALMAFYLSLCNVFVPLPTAWIILFAASPEVHLFDSAGLRILAVAGLGALATALANLNEYHLLAFLLRPRLGGRLRQTRLYRWAVRWFDRAPFLTLAAIGFLPIPVDAIRWLAILRQYPRIRFGLAYFCGRGGRYAALAGLSIVAHLNAWEIVLFQAGIVLLAVLARLGGPGMARAARGWGRAARRRGRPARA